MRNIRHLLHGKKILNRTQLDEKSLAYVFDRIILGEYGRRGLECVRLERLEKGNLFVVAENGNWNGEIVSNKKALISKFNEEIGDNEIGEIWVKNS